MGSKKKKRNIAKAARNNATSVSDSVETVQSGVEQFEEDIYSTLAPPELTEELKRQIKKLPLSEDIWYVHVDTYKIDEGKVMHSKVYEVLKEHGSNGMPIGESNGLFFPLNLVLLPPGSVESHHDEVRLILGGIIKACFEPAEGISDLSEVDAEDKRKISRPRRPTKILFQSKGTLALLRPHLKVFGIKGRTADSALLTSAEIHEQNVNNCMFHHGEELLSESKNNVDYYKIVGNIFMRDYQEGRYVLEDQRPLGDWTPTEDVVYPIEWFACPPPKSLHQLPDLWGWRTNLERAVMAGDIDKIIEITKVRNRYQVREFCECRVLLAKVADKGILKSCRTLLDYTDVSVDGVQAMDTRRHWRAIQEASTGSTVSLTPLHLAAFSGHCEILNLLLDRGASINAISYGEGAQGPALHHAVFKGHSDCVALLCDRGSDVTYVSPFGDAMDISYIAEEFYGEPHKKLQHKIRRILRQYDPRCSYCRADNASILCKCKLERYCNYNCMQAGWGKHQAAHEKKMADSVEMFF